MASVLSLPQNETATLPLPAAAPVAVPVGQPATLRSDRVTFAFWLACAAVIVVLMVKDYAAALLGG